MILSLLGVGQMGHEIGSVVNNNLNNIYYFTGPNGNQFSTKIVGRLGHHTCKIVLILNLDIFREFILFEVAWLMMEKNKIS